LMEDLLNNALNEELTWGEGDTTCHKCAEDETVSDDLKVSAIPSLTTFPLAAPPHICLITSLLHRSITSSSHRLRKLPLQSILASSLLHNLPCFIFAIQPVLTLFIARLVSGRPKPSCSLTSTGASTPHWPSSNVPPKQLKQCTQRVSSCVRTALQPTRRACQ
jgi:hypothetical protein